jgi:hypothetical protein
VRWLKSHYLRHRFPPIADDAVLTAGGKTYTGKHQIKAFGKRPEPSSRKKAEVSPGAFRSSGKG